MSQTIAQRINQAETTMLDLIALGACDKTVVMQGELIARLKRIEDARQADLAREHELVCIGC